MNKMENDKMMNTYRIIEGRDNIPQGVLIVEALLRGMYDKEHNLYKVWYGTSEDLLISKLKGETYDERCDWVCDYSEECYDELKRLIKWEELTYLKNLVADDDEFLLEAIWGTTPATYVRYDV